MKYMTRHTLHYCQPLPATMGQNHSQVDPPVLLQAGRTMNSLSAPIYTMGLDHRGSPRSSSLKRQRAFRTSHALKGRVYALFDLNAGMVRLRVLISRHDHPLLFTGNR